MWPVAWAMAKRSRATSTTWPGGTSSRCGWSSSAAPLSRRKLDQPKKEAGSAEGGAYPRPRPRAAARHKVRGVLGGETRRQKLPGKLLVKPRLALKALHVHLKCETAAEEIFRPLRIGKEVLLLIEDTLEVAKQTFAIGGVVRLRGLMLSLPGCAQRGLSQN